MTPEELRALLLWEPKTAENYDKLPKSAGALWVMRPTRRDEDIARGCMYVRGSLIGSTLVYGSFFHGMGETSFALVFVIACYEFAYYTLRQDKNAGDFKMRVMRHSEDVDALIKKLYPGWKPVR